MAKHKKTRQEKMVADQRHVLYHLETPARVSIPTEKREKENNFTYHIATPKTQTLSYSYVASDIKKTTVITLSIILAQIILFIVLNKI